MHNAIKLAAVCAALLPFAAFAGNKANPDAIELAPLPVPVEFKTDIDKPVAFDALTTVVVDCPDAEGAEWLKRHGRTKKRVMRLQRYHDWNPSMRDPYDPQQWDTDVESGTDEGSYVE